MNGSLFFDPKSEQSSGDPTTRQESVTRQISVTRQKPVTRQIFITRQKSATRQISITRPKNVTILMN